jgi:hypothetical protein
LERKNCIKSYNGPSPDLRFDGLWWLWIVFKSFLRSRRSIFVDLGIASDSRLQKRPPTSPFLLGCHVFRPKRWPLCTDGSSTSSACGMGFEGHKKRLSRRQSCRGGSKLIRKAAIRTRSLMTGCKSIFLAGRSPLQRYPETARALSTRNQRWSMELS